MKIGYLISDFYPYKGGREDNCFYLARELANHYDIHIFTSLKKGLKKEEIIDGIKIHRFKTLFQYRYYLNFIPDLMPAVLKEDLNILHVHSFGFLYKDIVVLLKKLSGNTKLINTPHGPFMALPSYPFYAKIFRFFVVQFEKLINRLYDIVIQVNPLQYKWLTKYGVRKEKIKFVPNGITKETFRKIKSKNKYKIRNKIIISYVGRIQEYKGLDQLIWLLPKFKKLVFIIAGRDLGDKSRLEKLAKKLNVSNQIIFTGEVSELDKLRILDVSEIFILPSQWEAFGITILEAMARGNAVISTKTEGGKFLIKENENGFLFKYGNLKELEFKLKTLIRKKTLRNKIKKNNLKKAREFIWDKIAKDLEQIYLNLK